MCTSEEWGGSLHIIVCYYSKWNKFSEDKVKAEAKCVSRKQTKFMSIKIEDCVCLSLILVIVLPKCEVNLDCFLRPKYVMYKKHLWKCQVFEIHNRDILHLMEYDILITFAKYLHLILH